MNPVNETDKAAADSHAQATDTANAAGGSTSQATPRTFSEKEYVDGVNAARTEAVRNYKKTDVEPIIAERNALRIKAVEIQNTQETIANLEAQLETLAKGDVDRLTFVNLNKQLREQKSKLATKEAELTDREASVEELKVKDVEDKRKAAVDEVVKEFEATPEALKALAVRLNLGTADEIRKEATLLWTKKAPGNTLPPMDLLPGKTNGGADNWRNLSSDEKISLGLKRK